ncbi:hypothetical protein [Streptomyces sp. NPDC097640]|uniref:hypothetical protein n=1 Tax=Streptomyces sp. NPDC097640 TaxID=3157229 RepID=UPI00331AD1A5
MDATATATGGRSARTGSANGSAGSFHVVTTGVVGIDDFNFLNRRSDVVFAALHATNHYHEE